MGFFCTSINLQVQIQDFMRVGGVVRKVPSGILWHALPEYDMNEQRTSYGGRPKVCHPTPTPSPPGLHWLGIWWVKSSEKVKQTSGNIYFLLTYFKGHTGKVLSEVFWHRPSNARSYKNDQGQYSIQASKSLWEVCFMAVFVLLLAALCQPVKH